MHRLISTSIKWHIFFLWTFHSDIFFLSPLGCALFFVFVPLFSAFLPDSLETDSSALNSVCHFTVNVKGQSWLTSITLIFIPFYDTLINQLLWSQDTKPSDCTSDLFCTGFLWLHAVWRFCMVFGALYSDDFSSVLPESNAKSGRITVASGEVHSAEERLFLFEE